MKALLTNLLVLIALAAPVAAASQAPDPDGRPPRKEWMQQMRRYKAEYIADYLKLSAEQREKFIPLYEEMDERTAAAGHDVRQMERNIKKRGSEATEADYDAAIKAQFELKRREADIEAEYLPRFKAILTRQQTFRLKEAEREFMRQLMERHRGPHKQKKGAQQSPRPRN